MPSQLTILGARRAYEFAPDQIRLTVLAMENVRERIRAAFAFDVAQVAPPMPTFGPVPPTIPPGLVFDYGEVGAAEGPTPVRFMHFEQGRIVVDVAGYSEAIDRAFDQLKRLIADTRAPDGSPAVGEPTEVRDHSELTARLDFSPDALLPPQLRDVFRKVLVATGSAGSGVVVPAILVPTELTNGPYAGTPTRGGARAFQLELRKESTPEARIYYSAAPLPTDDHLAYLEALEAALRG